ncbi:hypothetical protein DSL72_004556 [Monilinia vaccinii-corymbosi]|uniref:Zn(2)-C6 fungal-type domain-containing protein n=1 Tax=Monilinia vaccinii-corymbosi TaxID=61207 RepID=A0A8A3P7L4_9HELO|nr:hypothetical protein DSL72_004556 [Monilinia vaccinii-corymbosi]
MSATTERLRNSCDQCSHSKIRCNGDRPNCLNCRRRDRPCSYSHIRQAGRPRRARPTQPNPGNYELTESVRDDVAPVLLDRCCLISASNTSSTTPETAGAPEISTQLNYDQLETVLDGKTLHYDGYDSHNNRSRSDLPLENPSLRPVDLMDSLPLTQVQHPISTDYSSSVQMEADLSMAFDAPTQNQINADIISLSMEQSSTVVDHCADSEGHQLEQCFEELLDNSRINAIVDHIVNPLLHGKFISCSLGSCDRCFNIRVNDNVGMAYLCQCSTLLNRLYVIVMNPRLSQSAKLIPLDLILLLEQALQDTKEAITRCTICASSRLSSANEITLCLAADWVANCIRDNLEREVDTFTGNKASCYSWGYFDCQSSKPGMEHHHGNAKNATPPPPSLDPQNSLQVGMWNASREAWTLCVSAVLTSRIKRLQQMLSNVGTKSSDLADGTNLTATARAGNEMAKDIHAKTEILLGMVKTWTSRYTEY